MVDIRRLCVREMNEISLFKARALLRRQISILSSLLFINWISLFET